MADKTETVALNKGAETADETVTQTWVDLGDGTHAPKSVATFDGEELFLAPDTYLGEQTIAGNDAAQPATLPDGTRFILIMPEGGLARATVNGTATSNSGYYAADGQVRPIGPFDNINSLSVLAATGVSVHLVYHS